MKVLTFDIEEWFHILDNFSTKSEKQWNNYECRIFQNMQKIFYILENTNTSATFFCLGWIAKKHPEVIKAISSRGYEIGSHTYAHQLVYEQNTKSFTKDLDFSIGLLEDLTGKKIKYFRAPGFSITKNEKWAFEILASRGIEVDCSVFPTYRSHGGFPEFGLPKPSVIRYNGIELKELPISFKKIAGIPFVFSGGGYFRLLPFSLIKELIDTSDYVMSYFHPRDFDYSQPIINELPYYRIFKSYVGLKHTEEKLTKILKYYRFHDIKNALLLIDWNSVKRIDL